MTLEEIVNKIDTDPDFICSKRFDYSLAKFQERYPEGAPLRTIAQVLACTEEEVEVLYQQVVLKLRAAMKVEG